MFFLVVVFAVLAWLIYLAYASSINVHSGHVVAVFRFGRFDRVLRPGLNFIVPLIETTEKYPTQTQQFELPDDPEKIDRENKNPEPGKTLPLRVVHKGMEEARYYVRKEWDPKNTREDPFDNTRPLSELKKVRFPELPESVQKALEDDILNSPLTSEASGVIEWHIEGTDKSIEQLIENLHAEGDRDRVEEVRKRATDMVAKLLQEHVSPTTLGHAIFMAPAFNALLREEMEFLVGEKTRTGTPHDRPWGIHIDNAYLKPFDPGKTINKGRADAESAKYQTIRSSEGQAAATRNQAAAEKDRLTAEGEGLKSKQLSINEGLADRLGVLKVAAESELASVNFRTDREAEALEKLTNLKILAVGSNSGVIADGRD